MSVQANGTEVETKFDFYTYTPAGRDVIIPIFAVTEDEAWVKFDKAYGKDTPVDMVKH